MIIGISKDYIIHVDCTEAQIMAQTQHYIDTDPDLAVMPNEKHCMTNTSLSPYGLIDDFHEYKICFKTVTYL